MLCLFPALKHSFLHLHKLGIQQKISGNGIGIAAKVQGRRLQHALDSNGIGMGALYPHQEAAVTPAFHGCDHTPPCSDWSDAWLPLVCHSAHSS